jgi:sec-independent protein translocase protein TatA
MTLPGIGELLVILAIVLLVFGVGRVSKLGGEMGTAIANFRKGLNEGKEKEGEEEQQQKNEETPVS